jgi:hypothetical protein
VPERCVLCNFPLDERAVVIGEGKLCSESMGCRRRALKIMRSLQANTPAKRRYVALPLWLLVLVLGAGTYYWLRTIL